MIDKTDRFLPRVWTENGYYYPIKSELGITYENDKFNGDWNEFKDLVSLERYALENFKDYDFIWTSKDNKLEDRVKEIQRQIQELMKVYHIFSCHFHFSRSFATNHCTKQVSQTRELCLPL